jgi:hypothetical protein
MERRPYCHPFQPGQRVTVFRFGHFRRPLIEGQAEIVSALADKPDVYLVRFEGERRTRERLVHPGAWQNQPDRLLRQLIAAWQQSLTPELLREFFADEVRLEERAR